MSLGVSCLSAKRRIRKVYVHGPVLPLSLSRFIIWSSDCMLAWDNLWLHLRPGGCRHPRHTILASAECGPGPDASIRLSGPTQGTRGDGGGSGTAKR